METIIGFILVIAAINLYFLPAIVAGKRDHRNAGAITVLNLFLGWTFVVWVIALVWACTDNVRYDGPVVTTGMDGALRRR